MIQIVLVLSALLRLKSCLDGYTQAFPQAPLDDAHSPRLD